LRIPHSCAGAAHSLPFAVFRSADRADRWVAGAVQARRTAYRRTTLVPRRFDRTAHAHPLSARPVRANTPAARQVGGERIGKADRRFTTQQFGTPRLGDGELRATDLTAARQSGVP